MRCLKNQRAETPPSDRFCCHGRLRLGTGARRVATAMTLLLLPASFMHQPLAAGQIEIQVVDNDTNEPLAATLYLKDARGRSKHPRDVPFWKDHFAFDGSVILRLPRGRYTFEIERGPEYQLRRGHFEISRTADGLEHVRMHRFVDMKKEGWWSGDLHIHRAQDHVPLLMRAEDLHVASIMTSWNGKHTWENTPVPEQVLVAFDENRYYHVLGGQDKRAGGTLLYLNLDKPVQLPDRNDRSAPPMARILELGAEQPGIHIDIENPRDWAVPVWLALDAAHSIGLANGHMRRDAMSDRESRGKPRNENRYPGPSGTGYWSQDIYYHILNCGIRIPPSAGSASGEVRNPVGYNRVYVHCPQGLTWESWWEGLRAGRVVVTNGPLLRPRVNGHYPGHVFKAETGETVSLVANLNLSLRDRVEYLEVVKNGTVVHKVRLEEYRNRKGSLPPVSFQSSGWMLVRAVAETTRTFRFASTGPYYVEIGGQPHISRKSAAFFLDWVHQRAAQLDRRGRDEESDVVSYYQHAREFWQDKLQNATAP